MFAKIVILGALCLLRLTTGAPTEGQVVNGTDAKPGEIPYIVSLRLYHNHNCGGTILDATHIMTAAHCAQGSNAASLSIQYGVTKITAGEDAPNLIQVKEYVVNPDYSPGYGYYNDVSVLTGDSGGPLVCDGVQVGIVSWSIKPCAFKGYPGVFTKVSAEVPFVDQQLLN